MNREKLINLELTISSECGKWNSRVEDGKLIIENFHPEEYAQKKGVYLWSVKLNKQYLIYYVGKTDRNFKNEIDGSWGSSYRGGRGNISDPIKFAKGIRENIFPCDIDCMGRLTNRMGSKQYKQFWKDTFRPKWNKNNSLKKKLSEMLNQLTIHYILITDEIESECLEAAIGMNLFNSSNDKVSHFMNENDFGPFQKSNKKYTNNYANTRQVKLINSEYFYGLPNVLTCPFDENEIENSDYYLKIINMISELKQLSRVC